MSNSLNEMIQHENEQWSKIFSNELNQTSFKKYSSYWWEEYYEELSYFGNTIMQKNKYNSILEPGCGSGKATLLLDSNYTKTLLDISPSALTYAEFLSQKLNQNEITYQEGNIFEMNIPDESFDFVWNIGVIEHYKPKEISLIIKEMIRVSSKNGSIAIGMPNFYSGPTLKAWILKYLKFIPGYKLDTEHFYSTKSIINIIEVAAKASNKNVGSINIDYFGNPLIMETPKFFIKTIGYIAKNLFKRNKFLIMISCTFI